MPEIRTELEIGAPPKRVWDVLADFGRYPEWNPFLVRLTGSPVLGAKVVVHVKSGILPVRFRTKVLVAEPERELRWRGNLLTDALIAGEHYFQIEPLGDRSRFIHGERFTGALANVAWRIIEGDTRRGYEAMNSAFKARVER